MGVQKLKLQEHAQELLDVSILNALHSVQAVILFDPDGTIVAANDNFLKTVGYKLEEIIGKHHQIFCDPEYTRSSEYVRFWEELNDGKPNSKQFKRYSKSGKAIWIQADYTPILGSDGKVSKVVKFATDITATKLIERDTSGKLSAIDRSQAIIEFTSEGEILSANENFLTAVGYSLEEIKGKHHKLFCDSKYIQSQAYKEFWDALGRGEFQSAKYVRYGKNNKEIWIQATYNPILDETGKVIKVVKFASDITESVKRDQVIAQQVSELTSGLVNSIEAITSKTSELASDSQTLGATAEEMSAAVEELSTSIDSIAENGQRTDGIAKSTHADAETGNLSIGKSLEAMELINKSSEEIGEIVKVISEIAGQTNLLAFNAAIEAARAGEHGLGFSVVADEVRKLAERSSQATKDISKLISESIKRIGQGTEVSKEAANAFKKILTGVGQTTSAINEISVSAKEQQAAARDVSISIQQVAHSTEKSAYAAQSISKSVEELRGSAQSLKELVSVLEEGAKC